MIKSKQERVFQLVSHLFLLVVSLSVIIPFLIMLSSSFSSETAVLADGYSLYPREFSLDAYKYILSDSTTVLRAYGVTIFVTVAGTVVSLLITTMFAYVLAQDKLPFGRLMMFLVVVTMLFSGGLVPTYYIYTQIFHIKDTIFALIVPNLLMGAFNLILVRNYFRTSIPQAIIEAATIDGCSKFMTFVKVVLPLSLPIIATIGLMTALSYWNDWTNSLYYMNSSKYYSIQQVLRLMIDSVSYLQEMGVSTSGVENAQIPLTTVRMAIAVVAVVPVMIAYPFFQKYFVKGITIGAVKE